MNIEQAIQNIDNVLKDMNNIVVGAIMENEAEIIDLNTSQLEVGLSSKGAFLNPKYQNADYSTFKKAIGSKSPKGTPDLKLEGDFYAGFDIYKGGDMAWITSTDEKTSKLDAKYDNIFGIMPKNRPELLRIIAPEIKKRVLNRIIK